MKRNFIFTVLLIVFLSNPTNILASGLEDVSAGPGRILPDSPLYVFDKLYQKGKLLLAMSPQKRAEVRNMIMGERMAEVRTMYENGDKTAMGVALLELNEEGRKIESDLKDARAQGMDVSANAKTISDSLRFYRKVLTQTSFAADDDVASLLESASHSLLASKVVVEEFLRSEDLADARQNDLDDEGETAVLGVQNKADKLDKRLEALEKKADTEDRVEQKKLKIKDQRARAEEKRKLIAERKKKISETRAALKRAKEAARGFVETEKQAENPPVSVE